MTQREWEVVIGLETHAQLLTKSKIFSGASIAFGASPNVQACAVDLALPGTLPVLNREVVSHAIRLGLALGSKIAPVSVFARKNYFYPDLPKGYQISQMDLPVVVGGSLRIDVNGQEKEAPIHWPQASCLRRVAVVSQRFFSFRARSGAPCTVAPTRDKACLIHDIFVFVHAVI